MSVTYQELVEGVRDRAGTPDAQEAREVTGAVLGTLVHAVPADEHRTLLGALPAPVTDVAGLPVDGDLTGPAELLAEIGRRTGRTSEQARYLVQAVLEVLDDQDPDIVERIESNLPDEVVAALRPAGEAPGDAVTATPERPTALTGDEVSRALAGLEGWTGDERGISRTVALPDDRIPELVDRVQAEAGRGNDHARVRRDQGSVTFRLSTRRSGVTRPDVELAGRIDAVVGEVGSSG